MAAAGKSEFVLDAREFNAALKEYQEATQKDWAYVANRQALNVVIKTGLNTPIASRGKIRALPEREWWPKYVAKRIRSGKGVRIRDGKTKGGNAKYRRVAGGYTRADARKVSRALVQARLKRVGFIKSGWLPALKILTALKFRARGAGAAMKGTSQIQRPKGDATPAKPGLRPVALIVNHSKGAEKVGGRGLQKGLNLAAVDMREYIAERGRETAQRFSGK